MSTVRLTAGHHARALVGDVLLLAWILGWWAVAGAAKTVVDAVAIPVERTGRSTSGLAGDVDGLASQLQRVPMVGDDLSRPATAISRQLHGLTDQTQAQAASIHHTAWVVFVLVWLAPVATYAVLYLPGRIRRARQARAARSFIDEGADLDLFALRAMANCPMTALARISSDPVAAWRRGDARVVAALADLELRRVGIGRVEGVEGPGSSSVGRRG